MDWLMGGIAIILLVVGLVGQAFEMRRIRISTTQEGELGSPNIFADRRNFKWYALIGTGVILWYVAEQIPPISI